MTYILIVTNDPEIARVVKLTCEVNGLSVYLAKSGQEGLEAAMQWQFDLMLIDAQLPWLDGLLLTQVVRRDLMYPDIPIIGMTCFVHEDRLLLDAGADHVLFKPFKSNDLASAVADVLNREKQRIPFFTTGNHPDEPAGPALRVAFLGQVLGRTSG